MAAATSNPSIHLGFSMYITPGFSFECYNDLFGSDLHFHVGLFHLWRISQPPVLQHFQKHLLVILKVVGLTEETLHAQLISFIDIGRGGTCRKEQVGYAFLSEPVAGPYQVAQFKAVKSGHIDVGDNHERVYRFQIEELISLNRILEEYDFVRVAAGQVDHSEYLLVVHVIFNDNNRTFLVHGGWGLVPKITAFVTFPFFGYIVLRLMSLHIALSRAYAYTRMHAHIAHLITNT